MAGKPVKAMTDLQKWLLFGVIAGAGILLYLLAPILGPFLVAALLAYLGDPMVDRLEARRFPRTLAVVAVFAVIFLSLLLVLLFLVPSLQDQVIRLVRKVPVFLDWLQQVALPWVRERLGTEGLNLDVDTLRKTVETHWEQAGGAAVNLLATVSRSGLALAGWVANLLLIPVVTFYLLRDWDVLMLHIREFLPRRLEPTVVQLARESDEVLGAFLRGQLLVMLALGSIYAVGLWLVGLEFALLIGIGAGIVSFVPYLGLIAGIAVAGLAALFQFQDLLHVGGVVLVFTVAQLLEGMVLTPVLVGDRIGLHPVMVIFAVLAGGQLFGFVGILVALPATAVLMVLARHAHERYQGSSLYGDN